MNRRGALNIDCPIDLDFYNTLTGKRSSFTRISDLRISSGEGYGFKVAAGNTFRLTTTERVQLADLCVYNADDITERFDTGTQIAIEGNAVGRLTRIWGNPPRSRPLCTVIADTLRERSSEHHMHEHHAHGAHCNPHHWELFDHAHPHTCYDNLRKGLSMLGLGQTEIHDNVNLWSKKAWNPATGHAVGAMGDAEPGDCIEFYAEIDLQLSISLCPYGDGAVNPDAWAGAKIPLYPIRLEIFSTGVTPREWT
jgi:hypothetical protein